MVRTFPPFKTPEARKWTDRCQSTGPRETGESLGIMFVNGPGCPLSDPTRTPVAAAAVGRVCPISVTGRRLGQ
jgi:hypothetical protein